MKHHMFQSLREKIFDLKKNLTALTTSMVDKSYLCASTGSACLQSQKTSHWTGILPKSIYLAMLPTVSSRIKLQQTVYGLDGWPQLQCCSRTFKVKVLCNSISMLRLEQTTGRKMLCSKTHFRSRFLQNTSCPCFAHRWVLGIKKLQ